MMGVVEGGFIFAVMRRGSHAISAEMPSGFDIKSDQAWKERSMRICGTAIGVLAFVLGITPGFAGPIERATDTAECREVVARLLRATDESFDHYSPSGDKVFFRNRSGVLDCGSDGYAGISFTWNSGGLPTSEWFGLLAKAGKAVTGADLTKLVSTSRQCYGSLLKDKAEVSDVVIPNAKIECQALAPDGNGVRISIWMDALSVLPVSSDR
jgi:hypothetical protein